jgi:6-phosphogluconolactonase (cycloisomerase 2 family)
MRKVSLLCSGYSQKGHKDILLCSVNEDGKLDMEDGIYQGDNPSFLCQCKSTGSIYSCSEAEEYAAVTRYKIEDNKIIKEGEISFGGQWACHIQCGSGYIITAAYGSGTLSVIDKALEREVMNTGTRVGRDKESHAHWSVFTPDETYLLAADLGQDCIAGWPVRNGRISPEHEVCIALRDGTGPRQIFFSSDGSKCYVIGELDNTVNVFDYKGNGVLVPDAVYKISGRTEKCSTGGAVSDGKGRIIVANRGPDTVCVFDADKQGRLIKVMESACFGEWPRYIQWVGEFDLLLIANQHSDEIVSARLEGNELKLLDRIPVYHASCVISLNPSGGLQEGLRSLFSCQNTSIFNIASTNETIEE